MKLHNQRKDIEWLSGWITADCDCDTCNMFRGVKKRYQNMILMAEEELDPNRDIVRLIRKERKVRKDRVK